MVTLMDAGRTVTVADPERAAFAWLVATTWKFPVVVGEVYTPFESTEPPAAPSWTDQMTTTSLLPVTCAENCCVLLVDIVNDPGVTATWIRPEFCESHFCCPLAVNPSWRPLDDSTTVPIARVLNKVSLDCWAPGAAGSVRSPWSPEFCTDQDAGTATGL